MEQMPGLAGTVTTPDRVGARLAAARIERGITLDDVAQRTRVPKRHLVLIEAGATEGLPALTYTAGFVKSYAAALGLNGDALARDYRAEAGAAPRRDLPQPYEPADPARVPSRLLAVVALLLAVLMAGGYAIWRGDSLFGGGEAQERLAAGLEPAAPVPSPAAPPEARPRSTRATAAGPVVVAATEEAWVRIGERDGPTLFIGTLAANQRVEVPPTAADPVIRTSRPQSVQVSVGEVAIPPLAEPDTLVREASLKRDALLARLQTPLPPAPLQPLVPPPVGQP